MPFLCPASTFPRHLDLSGHRLGINRPAKRPSLLSSPTTLIPALPLFSAPLSQRASHQPHAIQPCRTSLLGCQRQSDLNPWYLPYLVCALKAMFFVSFLELICFPIQLPHQLAPRQPSPRHPPTNNPLPQPENANSLRCRRNQNHLTIPANLRPLQP